VLPLAVDRARFVVSSEGRTRRFEGKSIDLILERLRQVKLNRIVDKSFPRVPFYWKAGIKVTGITSILDISPTSSLWSANRGSTPVSAEDDREARSFASWEQAMTFHNVSSCPTLLETTMFLEVEAGGDVATLLPDMYERFYGVELPVGFVALIDLAEPTTRVIGENVISALSPQPKLLEQIGPYVDQLHDVILGSADLVKRMRIALGAAAVLRPCGSANDYGWLEIPELEQSRYRSLATKVSEFTLL
jgi:hypothetical protein